MWLRDGLPHDLKGARVLVYGYNTNLLESQTFQNVDDIAIAFSESIRSIRIHNRVSWIVRLWGPLEAHSDRAKLCHGLWSSFPTVSAELF